MIQYIELGTFSAEVTRVDKVEKTRSHQNYEVEISIYLGSRVLDTIDIGVSVDLKDYPYEFEHEKEIQAAAEAAISVKLTRLLTMLRGRDGN